MIGPLLTARECSALRRHFEWFLLERHSPALFGTPIERWADRWRAIATPELARFERALQASFSGVFAVTDVRPGEGVWLRDIAGFGGYPLVEPEGAKVLEPDDLIVGRLFPLEGQLCLASPAAINWCAGTSRPVSNIVWAARSKFWVMFGSVPASNDASSAL